MTANFRLTEIGGINRAKRLSFFFNGKEYQGFEGDTLASALLANGQHFVARSLKYHRPRGIFSAGNEEPNAIVQLERGALTQPNARATEIELYDGLEAWSVNCFPSLTMDFRAIQKWASPLLVAGFYNKTYKWPRTFWDSIYEPMLRSAAGLGHAPEEPDPDQYDHLNWHCEALVIGGGPAGLAAALELARLGIRIAVLEAKPRFGGTPLKGTSSFGEQDCEDWARTTILELETYNHVLLLSRTSAFGYYDHNFITAVEHRTDHLGPRKIEGVTRQRLWHFRAKQVVLATGAIERPIVFGNNDLPGVMLASAGSSYSRNYGVSLGKSGVAFINNDHGIRHVLDAHSNAGNVCAIVDPRPSGQSELEKDVAKAGIPLLCRHIITYAHGNTRVAGVQVRSMEGKKNYIPCDHVLVSGGFNPAVHLFSQGRGQIKYDDRLACFIPKEVRAGTATAGAVNGKFSFISAIHDGQRAARQALNALGYPSVPSEDRKAVDDLRILPVWSVQSFLSEKVRGKHFVDLQNDVLESDINLAIREGFKSIEHIKRYTTIGMGTDQGKTSNIIAHGITAIVLNGHIGELGTTTFRPPYAPVTFGTLAGRNRASLTDPVRVTPIHDWHASHGAIFEDVGLWKRPMYYAHRDESMESAVKRECLAARTSVGIMDSSTLGKIEVRGHDAAAFLDKIYVNSLSQLEVGHCRYSVMCKLDGTILDDGIVTRLAADHFLVSTTTGHASDVLDWLEEWLQTEWAEMEVYCTSVTEQWATIAVVGPKSRALLSELVPDLEFSGAAFPHMAHRTVTVRKVDARIARVSFSGELSYEISVPACRGLWLWALIVEAGKKYDLTPYGTESMHVLRAEKGYIIVGQDTDGTMTPQDVGLGWMVSKKKDFLGKRSLVRSDNLRSGRLQLVGLLSKNPSFVAEEGMQLLAETGRSTLGHVTSSYWSATLGRSFALAMLENGHSLYGQDIFCGTHMVRQPMTITKSVFFDADNRRLDG